MTPTDVTPEAAVRASDIVVLGVPSDKYKLPVDWVRAGAIIVNVASHKNIDEAALLAAPPHLPAAPLGAAPGTSPSMRQIAHRVSSCQLTRRRGKRRGDRSPE